MKQLFLLIAFVLANIQGIEVMANSFPSSGTTYHNYSSHVGQAKTDTVSVKLVKSDEVVRIQAEPCESNSTALLANVSVDTSQVITPTIIPLYYTLSISGVDSQMFSAEIIEISTNLDNSIQCKLSITYTPTTAGTHNATIHVKKDSNSPMKATVYLVGNASLLPGDANDDDIVDVKDLTEIISYILDNNTHINTIQADITFDGKIDISDATSIIEYLLNPSSTLHSTILITTTDNITVEYLIDENTKLKIVRPNLLIESEGQLMIYQLNDLKQLRYGQRMVSKSFTSLLNNEGDALGTLFLNNLNENTTIDVVSNEGRVVLSNSGSDLDKISLSKEPPGEYLIKLNSQTIKIVKQ